jgi:starch synthase
MTSLVPVYLRSIYSDDPLFHNYKIVYSVYNNEFKNPFRPTSPTSSDLMALTGRI